MGRTPRCEKINGLKRGPWAQEEDQKLVDYIQKHGHGSWRMLPKNAGLSRCGKSCRLRWTNYLRPDIKRGRFSFEEEETIIQLHSILGNKWSAIAGRLPGRTDNEIKNYWNTHIRKRLLRMGIDPVTHNPRLDLLDLSSLLSQQPFYNNQAQLDVSRLVLGVDPIVNSELLRIATDLLSAQEQNSNFLQPNIQEVQKPPFPSFQSHQLPEIPACTTSEATFLLEQTNLDDGTPCNFSDNFVSPQGCENYMYKNPNFDPKMENFKFGSVLSTPSSSSPTHLNSSSTYINSSTEDERDSYCSNGFNFQIPDLLDLSDFSLF